MLILRTLRHALFEPMVVMAHSDRIKGWTALKHELTHFIAFQSLPFQPPWFAEGLACYFETARFDEDERFVVGEVSRERLAWLRVMGEVRARELVTAESAELSAQFYASAWVLVHYLMSEHADAFVKFQDGLNDGLSATDAWARAFPHLPIERLEERIDQYIRVGSYAKFKQPVRSYAGPEPKLARLRDADQYALRARLYAGCPGCEEKERAIATDNLNRALKLEPDHLRASELRIAMLKSNKERLAAAESLTATHPEAWRAWLLRANSELVDGSSCTPDVAARLREVPAAFAQMFAAACAAAAGQKQEALDRSAQALRAQPADAPLWLLRAKLLLGLRECDQLAQLMPRLRGATHPKFPPEELASFEACH